jgi:8-oxo-dGTP pyrophosphatase MutT (NUDIX family)
MRSIISAILEKSHENETKIFLQKRWKPEASPTYLGVWEIPAGGIDDYEDVHTALRREVKEECGLDIFEIIDNYRGEIQEPRAGDSAFVFRPFLCQQVLATNGGLSWIGFVFRCKVNGEVQMNTKEAKDPLWVTVAELEKMLVDEPANFFPLQLPVLIEYCKEMKK